MLPADERFGAVEVIRGGVDLRLVVQLELLLRERGVQVALELDAVARRVSMPGSKNCRLLRPRCLAQYIAASACAIRFSAHVPSAG